MTSLVIAMGGNMNNEMAPSNSFESTSDVRYFTCSAAHGSRGSPASVTSGSPTNNEFPIGLPLDDCMLIANT